MLAIKFAHITYSYVSCLHTRNDLKLLWDLNQIQMSCTLHILHMYLNANHYKWNVTHTGHLKPLGKSFPTMNTYIIHNTNLQYSSVSVPCSRETSEHRFCTRIPSSVALNNRPQVKALEQRKTKQGKNTCKVLTKVVWMQNKWKNRLVCRREPAH